MSAYSDSFECESSSSPSSLVPPETHSTSSHVAHSDSSLRTPATGSHTPVAAEDSNNNNNDDDNDNDDGGALAPTNSDSPAQTQKAPEPKVSDAATWAQSVASDETLGSHAERKIDAYHAHNRSHFKLLEKFVAFCEDSVRPSVVSEPERPSFRVSGATHTQSTDGAAKTKEITERSGESRGDNPSDDSAFSTLSQHLTRRASPRDAAQTVDPAQPAQSETPAQSTKTLELAQDTKTLELAQGTKTLDPAQGTRPLDFAQSTKTLDPAQSTRPLDFAQSTRPLDFAQSTKTLDFAQSTKTLDFAQSTKTLDPAQSTRPLDFAQSTKTLDIAQSTRTSDFAEAPALWELGQPVAISADAPDKTVSAAPQRRAGVALSSLSAPAALSLTPPPLPPPAAPDARVSELRETSEAVERLVRAFALLRGHAVPPRAANDAETFASRETAPLAALRAEHGVGDAHTLRWRQRRNGVAPQKTDAEKKQTGDADAAAAAQANVSAAEEAICSLVMEMLQSRGGRGAAISPAPSSVIGMDEFRVTGASSRPRKARSPRRDPPLSVFDGELRAFAPGDADAADALRHGIRRALDRYVSTHVSPRARLGSSCVAPATASFVWALQLDLLAVCLRALETHFDAGARAAGHVWIRYDGPRDAETLARNAVHCLPFEALDSHGGARLTFRMEYWVTRDKLFIVADALASSVRNGIAASADVYESLRADAVAESPADSDALIAPRAPLFALLPNDSARGAKSADNFARGARGAGDGSPECFGLPPRSVEAVARAVAAAATELIGAGRGAFAEQFSDAAAAVAAALCEMLSDESIAAAVARRARAKIEETQRRREEDTRADRGEKERAMIEAAEKEAERVVQRIMQEMRVEAASRA